MLLADTFLTFLAPHFSFFKMHWNWGGQHYHSLGDMALYFSLI
jgi:hypothetical protein